MQISSDEALSALKDVDTATSRRAELRSYQIGSPHLILWGVIWLVGYTINGFLAGPNDWWMIWIPGPIVGVVGGILLSRRFRWPAEVRNQRLGLIAVGGLFIFTTYWIMRPHSAVQFAVYPPIIVAAVYAAVGVLRSPRYLMVGAALFVLSLVGYVFFRPWLDFWLAAVGGGGLILSGLWFRKPI